MIRKSFLQFAALVSMLASACMEATAPAPTPFAPGELRALIGALDTVGGTDAGPYTAAAALLYAQGAGTVRIDSIIASPTVGAPLTGSYRALAVLMNISTTPAGTTSASVQSFIAVIGWNGYSEAAGTVENAFVVSLNATRLLPPAGTAPPAALDRLAGFAMIANRPSGARFFSDSGAFTASRWTSGTPTLCVVPGGSFFDVCNHALGTLDGSFSFDGTTAAGTGRVGVRPVSFSGVPLVVMNWAASL